MFISGFTSSQWTVDECLLNSKEIVTIMRSGSDIGIVMSNGVEFARKFDTESEAKLFMERMRVPHFQTT